MVGCLLPPARTSAAIVVVKVEFWAVATRGLATAPPSVAADVRRKVVLATTAELLQ